MADPRLAPIPGEGCALSEAVAGRFHLLRGNVHRRDFSHPRVRQGPARPGPDLGGGVPGQPYDLRRMARFRNRIVHLYAQVDLPTVYRLLQERLADFDRYLIAIERYLPASRGPEDLPHGA
jgi:hypothetical protein